jgi:hypothetical protein
MEDGGWRMEDGKVGAAEQVVVGVGDRDAVHLRGSKPACLGDGAMLM